jgi:phosphinothricin acetyltransferase
MTKPPISIRTATTNDAGAVQAIYAPYVEKTAISFEEIAPNVDEMAARIEAVLQNYPYLIAEREDQIIGYAYAGRHAARAAYRFSVEVTAYVAEDARRTGVGRALYGVLLPELAGRGFHAAYAGVTLPNPASVGLLEAVGFEQLGTYREVGFKFGQWLDVGWWQKILGSRQPTLPLTS